MQRQGELGLWPPLLGQEAAQESGVLKGIQPEIIMAITIGALIGLVKASREGNIKLTPKSIADAEEVCWSGISSHAR